MALDIELMRRRKSLTLTWRTSLWRGMCETECAKIWAPKAAGIKAGGVDRAVGLRTCDIIAWSRSAWYCRTVVVFAQVCLTVLIIARFRQIAVIAFLAWRTTIQVTTFVTGTYVKGLQALDALRMERLRVVQRHTLDYTRFQDCLTYSLILTLCL
jgi:hypothetical protein